MESHQNDYHISFFKPTTKIARLNREIVVYLVCIWTVAIFGFQIALKVFEKPTPEHAYLEYEQVWEQVAGNNASHQELQVFARTTLSVLGKNFIDPGHRRALDNGLSHSLYLLAGVEKGDQLRKRIIEFEEIKTGIKNITDPLYINAKNELASIAAPLLGLTGKDVRTPLISIELSSALMDELSAESREVIPKAMSTYLIHNQSFLTDGRILGFPFHYFYTSVFLLVLFVGLCWLYCVRTDRRDSLLGIKE